MAILTNKTSNDLKLSKEEIQLILLLIGQTTFPVKNIEILYNLILKLQKLHETG